MPAGARAGSRRTTRGRRGADVFRGAYRAACIACAGPCGAGGPASPEHRVRGRGPLPPRVDRAVRIMRPGFCTHLSEVLAREAGSLFTAWAHEVAGELDVGLQPYFDPGDPWIIRAIARYLIASNDNPHAAWDIMDRTRRVGEAAERGGVLPEQILDGFLILESLIWRVLTREIGSFGERVDVADLLTCVRRLKEAHGILTRVTTRAYFERYRDRIRRDTERLESFNRLVGHELRTPLSAIQGAATLLTEPALAEDPERRRHYVEMVERNAVRMGHLISDILALTTVLERRAEEVVEPVSIRAAARAVADRLEPEARGRGVNVEVDVPDAEVEVDGRALELVLKNLVRNGIRYADPAKSDRRVRVTADPPVDDGNWTLRVEDNGLGIPEGARRRIFERFYRAAPEVDEGTGLGLNIAKELIERWGGKIWFDSREGVGTVFSFTAPRAEGEADGQSPGEQLAA